MKEQVNIYLCGANFHPGEVTTNCFMETSKANLDDSFLYSHLANIFDINVVEKPKDADVVFLAQPRDKYDYSDISDKVICFVAPENVFPDLSYVDYAVSPNLELRSCRRHFYIPGSLMGTPNTLKDWELMHHKHEISFGEEEKYLQREFCARVVSNDTDAAPERLAFFLQLSKYKMVDSGGGSRNNVGGRVKDKRAFLASHKFSLQFENMYNSWISEKLDSGFAAGTVPIYWGNPDVSEIYNEKAFINCHKYGSFQEVIEEVKRLDHDDEAYMEMLRQPALKVDMDKSSDEYGKELEKFFSRVVQAGKQGKKECVNYNWYGDMQRIYSQGLKAFFFEKNCKNAFIHVIHYPWTLIRKIPGMQEKRDAFFARKKNAVDC